MNLLKTLCIYSTFVMASGAYAGQMYFVDDDGVQCPGAIATIQEAVAKARSGDTILVCPGTYQRTVVVKGHDKDAIKLIGLGHADEVVLQGDHMEMNGFHLEDVDNVVLRGFTVRDFGMGATETLPNGMLRGGMGNGIYLLNANYNTIENNRLTRNDMMGIDLWDSANNAIRYNLSFDNDTGGSACGIMLRGRQSARNYIFQNLVYNNGLAGLMIADAGSGNLVIDNDFSNNGRWGFENRNTADTWIEGNRVSYGFGGVGEPAKQPLAAICPGQPCGLGIHVRGSNNVTVLDNRVRSNANLDVIWDGIGQIRFEANACDTASHEAICRR